eukprot:TRINITY_DN15366_c0_g2_i5.p1 TRINITY_DN15366_c0_g2~~TRINITY_DN15366_c0_g2_i5.p1  ORF type:complete len:776 (+),score=91.77 TRINITY_DN15366_c0_g2_i5:627-2954(+)
MQYEQGKDWGAEHLCGGQGCWVLTGLGHHRFYSVTSSMTPSGVFKANGGCAFGTLEYTLNEEVYAGCDVRALNKCQNIPCIDLIETPHRHHSMWLNPVDDQIAHINEAVATNATSGRTWKCACLRKCVGLVGEWGCPGFYDGRVSIAANYGDDFTSASTKDSIAICALNSGSYIEHNSSCTFNSSSGEILGSIFISSGSASKLHCESLCSGDVRCSAYEFDLALKRCYHALTTSAVTANRSHEVSTQAQCYVKLNKAKHTPERTLMEASLVLQKASRNYTKSLSSAVKRYSKLSAALWSGLSPEYDKVVLSLKESDKDESVAEHLKHLASAVNSAYSNLGRARSDMQQHYIDSVRPMGQSLWEASVKPLAKLDPRILTLTPLYSSAVQVSKASDDVSIDQQSGGYPAALASSLGCKNAVLRKCKGIPCIDLQRAHVKLPCKDIPCKATNSHYAMWLGTDGKAHVENDVYGFNVTKPTPSGTWMCSCMSSTCDGLVGLWTCPGFSKGLIHISSSYGNDFSTETTGNSIAICALDAVSFIGYNNSCASSSGKELTRSLVKPSHVDRSMRLDCENMCKAASSCSAYQWVTASRTCYHILTNEPATKGSAVSHAASSKCYVKIKSDLRNKIREAANRLHNIYRNYTAEIEILGHNHRKDTARLWDELWQNGYEPVIDILKSDQFQNSNSSNKSAKEGKRQQHALILAKVFTDFREQQNLLMEKQHRVATETLARALWHDTLKELLEHTDGEESLKKIRRVRHDSDDVGARTFGSVKMNS